MDKITLKVKVSVNNLFEFMMYSNYASVRGVFSILFSIVCAVGTAYYWNDISVVQRLLMIFMAMMFTVIAPVEYYIRARRQVKKGFMEELEYSFDDTGITVSKSEESSSLPWESVMKVITTRNLIAVYFSPVRAFIIPKKIIGGDFDNLKKLMEGKTSCYKFKMER